MYFYLFTVYYIFFMFTYDCLFICMFMFIYSMFIYYLCLLTIIYLSMCLCFTYMLFFCLYLIYLFVIIFYHNTRLFILNIYISIFYVLHECGLGSLKQTSWMESLPQPLSHQQKIECNKHHRLTFRATISKYTDV